MATQKKLKALDRYFSKGKDFKLTDATYEKLVGERLPKRVGYLIKSSALSTKCKEEGFEIVEVQEKCVYIRRKI